MSPANVMRLKVSRGFSPASASFIVSFAFSIGNPDIEPGGIQHENEFLGRDVFDVGFVRRLQDQSKEPAP